jgi:predicted secreted Zn-dependent protease
MPFKENTEAEGTKPDILASLMFSAGMRFATRMMIAASVGASLELAAQPAPDLKAAPPRATARELPSNIRTDYYEVRGTNAEALLASMNAHGSSTNHASTQWRVDWDYDFVIKPDECILRSFSTRVRIRYILPQWVDWQRGGKALQGEWKRYLGALGIHESGHGGFGIAAAKEMVRLVNSREWRAPDHNELRTRIDEVCANTLREFRAQEVAYDQKTDHGRTQGACFRVTRQ